MRDISRKIFKVLLLLIWDMAASVAAVFIGLAIVYGPKAIQLSTLGFRYSLFFLVLAVVFHAVSNMYSENLKHFGTLDIVKHAMICACSGIIVYLLPRLLNIGSLPKIGLRETFVSVLVLFLLCCLGHGVLRLYNSVIRYYFYRLTGKEKSSRILIYGAGELGSYLARRLVLTDSDKRPVGFVDDNLALVGSTIAGLKVLGGRDVLGRLIDDREIQEVVLAVNEIDKDALRDILAVCSEHGARLRRFGSVQDVTSPTGHRLDMADVDTNDLIRRDRVMLDESVASSFIAGKTILVTGGAGSIGSEICNQVLKYGAKRLIIFDICENSLFKIDNKLRAHYDRERYETVLGSVRDEQRLRLTFEKYRPQVVFHAAAHKHVPMMEYNPCEAIKNNVFGTWNTAHTASEFGVEKFILISTDKAVNPTNIMGASKRIAEMVIQMEDRHSKTQFAAVRFGNVLGSEGSVVPLFLEQIKRGGPVRVTHPEMKRYFMTIPEAVSLVLEAGALACGGEIFVLDMGEPILISDLAADLIRLSGQVPNKDIDIVYTGLRPGEKLFEELSLSEEDATRTTNKKIFVCKPIPTDEKFLQDQADSLKENACMDNAPAVFEVVRHLVPTFNHQ